MKFEHLISATLCDFQLLLEQFNLPIAVGSINDNDFILLQRGYGELNWDYIITCYYSTDSSFDFCLKLKDATRKGIDAPIGAFLASYKIEAETLEIYGIEKFGNSIYLDGKMFLFSMFATFIFMSKIQGQYIKLIDVEKGNEILRSYYKQFGFVEDGEEDFILGMDKLQNLIEDSIKGN
ncbi:hypothetical protein [Testudinibacter aquarius]|uniref:GNAT family N-acetyltransferase n=1 Tax=Testudinibacter aquarius TaxID=1524974 RepID=A0A4R3Y527_9PAST|nr:hypothetical protein [Testudinibacter aquarius]KAE9527918.1 hypothetical protein A1D24_01485 [Testudinibacter aquarius]TCV86521.1 hypothetical protein EDC16_10677 [Testudinibacter aquarius]TNG93593.1 hypothetical protein FHQ21_01050 [Testudinibacter aquarius]